MYSDVRPLDPIFSMLSLMTLIVVNKEPTYGYGLYVQIHQMAYGRLPIQPSTVYKVLERLERYGYVEPDHVSTMYQKKRQKHYKITAEGRRLMDQDARLLRRVLNGMIGAKL